MVRRNAFKKGEWTTVVLPDVAKYPDGEYWQLKEYDEIENKVYFSEISDRKNLKENTPYVFKPAADVKNLKSGVYIMGKKKVIQP